MLLNNPNADICFAVEDSKNSARKQVKMSPPNREIAFSFQLHDNVRMCFSMAHASPQQFEYALHNLELQIAAYRQMSQMTQVHGKMVKAL